MERKDADLLWNNFSLITNVLPGPGVLVLCGDKQEKENLITLGWITFGYLWQEPSVTILVRKSRFSHGLLEKYPEFTLNVLSKEYAKQIEFCGSHSGAYCDKFAETGLTRASSRKVNIPSINEALLTLECRITYTSEMVPENLNDIYLAKYYALADYHTMFTANIVDFTLRK